MRNLTRLQSYTAGGRQSCHLALTVRLRDIALQGCWTETLDSESFLLANDGDDDKMLVFSTDKNLEILSANRDFYMDGTFSVSPHLFSQLYTLHVMFLGQMIPVVFALLANKAQNTYTRLFDILSHLCHTRNLPLDPRAIHADFEMAALEACRISFPQTSLWGCRTSATAPNHFAQTRCLDSQYPRSSALGLQLYRLGSYSLLGLLRCKWLNRLEHWSTGASTVPPWQLQSFWPPLVQVA
ncbi:hypothetical protein ACOMHN_056939 [Nucella lapillus]